MESKKAEINWGTAGSENTSVTIPKEWLEQMDITSEEGSAFISFEDDQIMIRKEGSRLMNRAQSRYERIWRFAKVWSEMYKNHASIPFYFFEDINFVAFEMEDLGFEMDAGESFQKAFPESSAFYDIEGLRRILDQIDVQILGNLIYSKWRYFNHWAEGPMEDEDFEWFVMALDRLAELTREDHRY